jgi:hypothetical protein
MRASTLGFIQNGALLLCLFAPSAWMIATIPPLWRDADAYVQVTENPLLATLWSAPRTAYTRLMARRLQRNKAIVAIARELCGFIWELLRTQACYQAQPLSS